MMVTFWAFFIVLYIATVHKSRKTVEFERRARGEERRRAQRTRQLLRG
jgi:hypothetical protein